MFCVLQSSEKKKIAIWEESHEIFTLKIERLLAVNLTDLDIF